MNMTDNIEFHGAKRERCGVAAKELAYKGRLKTDLGFQTTFLYYLLNPKPTARIGRWYRAGR